jgi:hypothetical protein
MCARQLDPRPRPGLEIRKQSCNHSGDARFASVGHPEKLRVWKKVAPQNQPVKSIE